MRSYVSAVLAAGTLVSSVLAGAATAATAPTGAVCSAMPMSETEGSRTAWVTAALVLGDAAGSVTCTVQTGWFHGEDERGWVTGPVAPGAAVAAGGVTYAADVFDATIVCTRVDLVDGRTLWWDALREAWSTKPDVLCGVPL